MFKYSGASCPVCHKKFTEDDDIVVCPDCGAPHHRACYMQNGRCALADSHGSGKAWQPPEQPEQRNTVEDIHCPNCGTNNPRANERCSVCGAPLGVYETETENGRHEQNASAQPGGNQYGWQDGQPWRNASADRGGIPPIPPNPFTTPYGGLDPDEMIGDISARDYVLFTGSNSYYFLPKFKDFSEKKRTFVQNWAAFFFTYFYYLYRKMYGLGLLILAAFLVLSAPAAIINMSTLQDTMIQLGLITAPMFNIAVTQQLVIMANVFSALAFGLRVFLGLYTNKLYYSHARNRILAVREQPSSSEEDYCFALARAGRTNRKLILIIVITFAVLYFLSVILMTTTMMLS